MEEYEGDRLERAWVTKSLVGLHWIQNEMPTLVITDRVAVDSTVDSLTWCIKVTVFVMK